MNNFCLKALSCLLAFSIPIATARAEVVTQYNVAQPLLGAQKYTSASAGIVTCGGQPSPSSWVRPSSSGVTTSDAIVSLNIAFDVFDPINSISYGLGFSGTGYMAFDDVIAAGAKSKTGSITFDGPSQNNSDKTNQVKFSGYSELNSLVGSVGIKTVSFNINFTWGTYACSAPFLAVFRYSLREHSQ